MKKNKQAPHRTHNGGKTLLQFCVSSNRLTGEKHALFEQQYDFDDELSSKMALKPIILIRTIDKRKKSYYKQDHKISYNKEMQLNQKFDYTNSNTS